LLNHCWYPQKTRNTGKRLLLCFDLEAQRRRCAVDPAAIDGYLLGHTIEGKRQGQLTRCLGAPFLSMLISICAVRISDTAVVIVY